MPKIAFFGTPRFSVTILEQLGAAGIMPSLIITAPDRPAGRGLVLTPPPVKVWAEQHDITCIQPASLAVGSPEADLLLNSEWTLFVVAAYGKILRRHILDLPEAGTLNVHPSLLPKFRGPSPIESQILADEREVGVSIMLLDEEMDHGPVVAQARIELGEWPVRARDLEALLAAEGGSLLAEVIPTWIKEHHLGSDSWLEDEFKPTLIPEPQEHGKATFTQKIKKEDGRIDLAADGYQNYLKYCAYDEWPGTYFFKDDTRYKITEATFENGVFRPLRVIPEGKKEQDWNA